MAAQLLIFAFCSITISYKFVVSTTINFLIKIFIRKFRKVYKAFIFLFWLIPVCIFILGQSQSHDGYGI